MKDEGGKLKRLRVLVSKKRRVGKQGKKEEGAGDP